MLGLVLLFGVRFQCRFLFVILATNSAAATEQWPEENTVTTRIGQADDED
jgi:hypothetical protein